MKCNIENMNTITSHITYTKYALIFTSIGSHLLEDILVPPTKLNWYFGQLSEPSTGGQWPLALVQSYNQPNRNNAHYFFWQNPFKLL